MNDKTVSTDRRSHIITDYNSLHLHRLRLLQGREERQRTGQFLIDGLRPVIQALQLEAKIETVVLSPQMLVGAAAERTVRQLRRMNIPMLSVTPEVYRSLSQAEEPQGIGAVVWQKWEPLHQLRPSRGLCWVAVEAVQYPGNLGTIIRTSEAVGGAGLILIGDSADPYDPTTVRASMGALFNQRYVRTTYKEFTEWKRRRQCTLVGASPDANQDYAAIAYPRPTMLLMGNERKGLSEPMQALCDIQVKIPMVGRSDSLNVAVATSVMLYELFNQRRKRDTFDAGSARPSGAQVLQAIYNPSCYLLSHGVI